MSNLIVEYSRRFIQIEPSDMPDEREHQSDVKGVDNELLSYIYGTDPNNGHLTGDLSVYLGDKANPEIKRYIEMNLLHENGDSDGLPLSTEQTNALRKVINDDDVAFFSRNHGETKDEYALRIRNYLEDEKARRAKYKADKEYKELVNRIANGK